MKLGLQINNFSWPGGSKSLGKTLTDVARTADEQGFYSVWVMDHFFQIGHLGAPEEPMLEAYTTLGFLAGVTKKVKLGTMVTGIIYREPALLVKAVSALDVLSGGRAYFGVGAAWNEYESNSLGFDFPPVKQRFEMLEEALKISTQMFDENEKPFVGKHYKLERPMNHPQVVSKPHPPILIGGGGEKKTLRLVAQYADACNLFARSGTEEVVHKLEVLKKHCKDVGRDYNEIEKTALSFVDGNNINPHDVVKDCQKLKEIGIDHVIFSIGSVYKIDPLKVFGKEIIPEVSKF
ncbi:LLM class F420-dependent oxidoreductase [Patescibacteria group bacterium]|nr:LLM class F420-dependent oxidoreductase [Patescibacteria group bacterium]